MRKFLKIIGIVIGVIVLFLIIAGLTINTRWIPSYDVNAPDLKVTVNSASIAHGTKLAILICMECHLNPKSRLMEGQKMDEDPAFGEIWSPNITNHQTKGSGRYTDGELAYLLRTGIKRDGEYAPPWMLKFPHMAESEIHDIIAFLRSDHPSVRPSETVQPASKLSFLVKTLSQIVFKPLPYPEEEITIPSKNDPAVYGEYLANAVYQCFSCHSADFTTLDDMHPEKSVGFYGGGIMMKGLDGNPIHSRNITMDKATGIGNWSADDFVQAVKYGKRPDGTAIMYPMAKFSLLDDEEVKAIYAYLKTVPVIVHEVKN